MWRLCGPWARDLTVEEVAEEMLKAPSTVRGWLISGALRGYKFNNREWRVTRSALRDYMVRQAATSDLLCEATVTVLPATQHETPGGCRPCRSSASCSNMRSTDQAASR